MRRPTVCPVLFSVFQLAFVALFAPSAVRPEVFVVASRLEPSVAVVFALPSERPSGRELGPSFGFPAAFAAPSADELGSAEPVSVAESVVGAVANVAPGAALRSASEGRVATSAVEVSDSAAGARRALARTEVLAQVLGAEREPVVAGELERGAAQAAEFVSHIARLN